MKHHIRIAALLTLVAMAGSLPAAITIHVPGDVPTITQAVALASSGDTILVAGGSYTESVSVTGLTLTFVAASPEETIWNGAGSTCMTVYSGGDVTAHGFVFQGASDSGLGAISGGSLTVENCTVQNNARWGVNAANGGHITVRSCLIRNNPPGYLSISHGAHRMDNSGTTGVFENNVIIADRNPMSVGIGANSGTQVIATGNVISTANDGVTSNNSGSAVTLTGNIFTNCGNCTRSISGDVNAGDLGNVDPTDDGGNVFFADNTTFFNREGGGIFLAEGNLYPRIDSAYLTPRVLGSVDYSPALHVVVERAATHPDPAKFPTPVPDGQFLEIRAVADEPGVYPIDLGDWMLSDDPLFTAGDEGIFEIPGGTTINTGQSIMFAWNLAEIDRVWGIHPAAQTFDLTTASPEISLSVASDEVFLSPSTVGIHDALLYGATDDTVDPTVWLAGRVPLGPEGTLFTRDLDSTDTNTAADWTSEFFGGRLNTTPVSGWEVYR